MNFPSMSGTFQKQEAIWLYMVDFGLFQMSFVQRSLHKVYWMCSKKMFSILKGVIVFTDGIKIE